jgi:ABC-2 type transport system permease protein
VSDARILDRGYRRYDGPRLGPLHAQRSVLLHTVQRVLGLRRPARSKVLPFLAIIIAYLPAATFIGLVALLPRRLSDFVPAYSDYYGFISAAIVLFVTFAAPEALCPDRRSRMLSLYLAAPLTRTRYLVAKAGAVALVITIVTVGPPLLLLIGRALQGAGPDGPVAFLGLLGRIVGSGLALVVFYTPLSMAVSSLTDRRALASGGTLLLLIGSGILSGVLVEGLDLPGPFSLVNLNRVPFELVLTIYGNDLQTAEDVATWILVAAAVGWSLLFSGIAWWRYRTLQVTR